MVHPIVFLPMFIALLIVISGCTALKGSIVIMENPNGKEFTMDFSKWNSVNKCEISLNKGDVLQVEVACEEGEIALAVNGKNGSQPYTGNKLKSTVFTVAVSETDRYVVRLTGNNATGKVIVKNISE